VLNVDVLGDFEIHHKCVIHDLLNLNKDGLITCGLCCPIDLEEFLAYPLAC